MKQKDVSMGIGVTSEDVKMGDQVTGDCNVPTSMQAENVVVRRGL